MHRSVWSVYTHLCILMRKGYFFRGSNSSNIVFAPSEKGSTLKGKNLLPSANRSFNSRVTPFQKGISVRKANRKIQKFSLLPCTNWQKLF